MLRKILKYSVLLLTLAIAASFMTACDSKEEKESIAKWEAQASRNAKAYIQQKYGFTPEITGTSVDRITGMFRLAPTSDVFVEMLYNDRDFTVYITGFQESTDGRDSYQSPDIKQALFDLINDEKDGLQVLDIYPNYKTRLTPDEPLYSTYFNGSNLAELLKDGANSFDAFYVQTDLSDPDDFSWFNSLNMNARFVSCRNGKILNADQRTRRSAAPQPVYCNNSRILTCQPDDTKSATACQTYNLYRYGDFYYYLNSSEHYDEGEPSKVIPYIEEIDPLNTNVFPDIDRDSEVISKAYSVTSLFPVYIHVYYPTDKLDIYKDPEFYSDHFHCATAISDDQSTRYTANELTSAGDYVYECFEIEQGASVQFMFVSDYSDDR